MNSAALVLAVLATAPAQQPQEPAEVVIEGRLQNGALETRIGDTPWAGTTAEVMKQLHGAGAGPDTTVVLKLPLDATLRQVLHLMEGLREGGFGRIELGASSPLERAPVPAEQEAPSLRIAAVHAQQGCASRPVCMSGAHWSIRVDQTECLGANALRKALRSEAANRRHAAFDCLVTVRVDGCAPYGLVAELMVACETAGFEMVEIETEKNANQRATPERRADLDWAQDSATAAPSVLLGLRLVEGAMERRIDRGPWVASETAWMESLRAHKVGKNTLLLLDSAPDVPWTAVEQVKAALQAWGFTAFSFLAAELPLDGPIASTGVGEPEAAKLARDIEGSFRNGDPSVYERALCLDELLRRAVGPAKLSVALRGMLGRQAEESIPSTSGTEPGHGQSAALHFLFVRSVEGTSRPVFRLLSRDRFDYVELVLGKDGSQDLRVVDVFTRAGGELLSERLRDSYLRDPEALAFLNRLRAPTPADLGLMGTGEAGGMMELLLDKKPEQALEHFEKNATKLRRSKVAHRIRLNIAGMVGTDALRKALEDFDREFPNDPSQPLLRVQRSQTS